MALEKIKGKILQTTSIFPNKIIQNLAKIKNKGGLPGSIKVDIKGLFGFAPVVTV